MAKLPRYELRTKTVTAWLCRDMDECALWIGKKCDIFWRSDIKQWEREPGAAGGYWYGMTIWNVTLPLKDFCNRWKIKPADLPMPGEAKRIMIQIPV